LSNMLSTVIHDDFVWAAISGAIHGTKRGSNGATMINCPMCVLRGETQDRRHRCGITRQPDGLIIHCYNCDFRGGFKVGEALSKNLRTFLEQLGIPSRDVQRINYKALQYRRMISGSVEAQALIPVFHRPVFQPTKMPKGAKTLSQWAEENTTEVDFIEVAEYLFSRGEVIASSSDFYWTPETPPNQNLNRRLLIPFTHNGQIVGWSGRLIDPSSSNKPKYWSNLPPHFIFNNEILSIDHKYVIVVEGTLDALAIGGVSPMGAKLSDEQANWLNTCGKTIIVVADRDRSGQRLIDHALKFNWMVSFPKLADGRGFQNWWDADVKDAAEATKRYGKLYTIRSIVESATASKIEINVKRKLLY